MSVLPTSPITGTASIGAADIGTLFLLSASGNYTISLAAAATLGSGWWAVLQNNQAITDTAVITIDPNASETIGGSATRVILPGERLTLRSDGTNIEVYVDQFYAPGWGVSTTWSNRTSYQAVGAEVFFTDVGVNGTKMRWTGSAWTPLSGGINLCAGISPMILQSSGSVAANGALSGITALPISAGPCYLYFPSGALYAGSTAGFYYAVLASTTTATVYNNMYSGSGVPTIPASPTAISAAGPGAYTQTTSAVTAVSLPILGELLGNVGQIIVNEEFTYNTAAGAKTLNRLLSGTTLISSGRTTSGGHDSVTSRLRAVGQFRQTFYVSSESNTTATSGHTISTKDLTTDQSLTWTLLTDTATNHIMLQNLNVQVIPG